MYKTYKFMYIFLSVAAADIDADADTSLEIWMAIAFYLAIDAVRNYN